MERVEGEDIIVSAYSRTPLISYIADGMAARFVDVKLSWKYQKR